jgi:AcrR family transcriptional regulator
VRKKDDKKVDQLFKAALQLVVRKGLAGITMSDIAKAAGMATGTLYIYFRNKEELIHALFLDCQKLSHEYYYRDLDPNEAFEKRFEVIFRNIMDFKIHHYEISVFKEQCFHSPYGQVNFRKSEKGMHTIFDFLEEGVSKGYLKPLGEDILLSFFFGCINELGKRSYHYNKKLTAEQVEAACNMCWDGMKLR